MIEKGPSLPPGTAVVRIYEDGKPTEETRLIDVDEARQQQLKESMAKQDGED